MRVDHVAGDRAFYSLKADRVVLPERRPDPVEGRQRQPRRLNGGVGRGRSRCCRAVLALAGLSRAFAYIVPTRLQSPIALDPCKSLILLEPASGLEPLTC